MNRIAIVIILSILALTPLVSQAEESKAQVMMMGLFHFSNPGKDTVKTDVIDVTSDASQAYLDALARRISEFKPTQILLEYDPKNQDQMQQRYQDYLDGKFQLPVNEIYQLGFRVAKLAGLQQVRSFDERNVHWNAKPLFDYMKAHDIAAQKAFDQLIAKVTSEIQQAQTSLTLQQLLQQMNTQSFDDQNKYIYLLTNDVGAGENFVGADATASWWHRNFRMYANIQKWAQPGERVFVIGGQGHTAILKDLLAIDLDRDSVDIVPLL